MVDLLGHKFSMAFLINNKKVLAYTIHYTPKLAKEHLQRIKRFHNLDGRIVFDNNLEEKFERIIRDRIFKDRSVNVKLDNYRYLAKRTGYRIREIIHALKYNPFLIIIPCHRVIRKDGNISEYTPLGKEFKMRLLQIEGIKVKV